MLELGWLCFLVIPQSCNNAQPKLHTGDRPQSSSSGADSVKVFNYVFWREGKWQFPIIKGNCSSLQEREYNMVFAKFIWSSSDWYFGSKLPSAGSETIWRCLPRALHMFISSDNHHSKVQGRSRILADIWLFSCSHLQLLHVHVPHYHERRNYLCFV